VPNRSQGQCNSFNIDFKQGANRDNFTDNGHTYVLGEIHWIGSILQSSNSRYIEGMSTLQRVVFNNLASCNGNHVLRMKMESRKADQHAYDFVTSWDNALKAAAAIAPGFGLMPTSRSDPKLHECGPDIGACSGTACNLVTNNGTSGGTFRDLPVIFSSPTNASGPGEGNLVISGPPADQNTTRQVIGTYECRYGDNIVVASGPNAGTYQRSIRVYVDNGTFSGSNGDANNAVYFAGYGDSNPGDGGDTYIFYDIKWQSPSPDVVIEYAAHIGVGVDGLAALNPGGCNITSLGVGYLINHGASSISGGPYHTIIVDFQDAPGNTPHCEGNLGNLDNQLQGSEVLLIPSCNLTGPGAVCAGATGITYSANIINTESTVTYAWSIINSTSAGTTITSATNTAGPITVTAGSTGSYTVQLIVLNGGTTSSIDDDIADTCTVTTNVNAGPNISCPTATTTAACQTQAAVDAAFTAWLAGVSATGGTATNNGGTSGPDRCGGSKTVIFTVSNTCGTSTCSSSFTVTAPPTASLHCPDNFTTGSCQTQAAVDAAFTAWLQGASGSGGCNGNLSNNGGTAGPDRCGGSKVVTFTYTNSCSAAQTCTASFTVSSPPAVSLHCPDNFTTGSCQTQAAVDAAFTAWLATATSSGGCNGSRSNNGGTAGPDRCGGTKVVTFTYTSSCAPALSTCTASFTVAAPPTVSLHCPDNMTVGAGQTQAQVDAAFTAWLAQASASGGCNGSLSNNNNGAPNFCGGSKTVTFTYTSSCAPATTTCSATFTVTGTATAAVHCPDNFTTGSCQTQAAVDAAFTAWLAQASGTGGTVTNNGGTAGPDRCGGSKTVTFTVTNSCSSASCSATFTVAAPPPVSLHCPDNFTTGACQTQAQVDAAFTAWLATATSSGGCNGARSNNGGTAGPDKCGGTKVVTFTYTSSCAPATTTCTASFTVTSSPAVSLHCPDNFTTGACQTQAQVDAAFTAWLATATSSGGCNGSRSDNGGTAGPDKCGGSKTVTFTYTSTCAPLISTCTATFTVTSAPPVSLHCPDNVTTDANQTQAAVDAAFSAWLASASASGGCNGSLSDNNTGAPDHCGGTTTVTFTYTSTCAPLTSTCSATFTVPPGCVNTLCTYTQGYYGNAGGTSCNGSPDQPNKFTTAGLISNSLAYWGGSLTVGCAGHSVTINNTSADITCLINEMPGTTSPKVLPAGDFGICSLPSTLLKNGKIANVLLGQTIALGLNIGVQNGTLGNFALDSNKYLVTADVTACGSSTLKECTYSCVDNGNGTFTYTRTYTPYHVGCTFSGALIKVLHDFYTQDVLGLYHLANDALCGSSTHGISLTEINNALDCINNAFDGCRSFVNWSTDGTTPCPATITNTTPCPAITAARPTGESVATASNLKVTAYPNPFTSIVKFTIQSAVSGEAQLEVYNQVGQKISTIYRGYLQAHRNQVVEYKAPRLGNQLIYVLRVGGQSVTGKLLHLE
jgi:hypothetical protein